MLCRRSLQVTTRIEFPSGTGLADLALQYEQLMPQARISMSLSRSLIGSRRRSDRALVAAR
ncbi:hypothetical protein AAW14_24165 [Streptomyces hygroscopicus]|nr:hypothetical protein [Streptomyces hygroscopicus]